MNWRPRACPRCRGDHFTATTSEETVTFCLQCGHETYAPTYRLRGAGEIAERLAGEPNLPEIGRDGA